MSRWGHSPLAPLDRPAGDSPPCSDAARLRRDSLAGTAAPARAWLLIEHHGPWPIDAFGGSGLHETLQHHLQAAAAAAGARILLVRRPGRRAPTTTRSWAVVHGPTSARPRSQAWGRWTHEEDLMEAVPALGEVRQPSPGGGGPPAEGPPLFLVCAHGRHDVCCAVRGRPVAAALQRRWPDQTRECSHVGGCRFAGNVVVLPDGAYYGGLDADEAPAVVGDHVSGRVSAPFLRGTSSEPAVAQAAIAEVHRRGGPAAGAVHSRGVERLSPTTWRVLVQGPGEPLEVELEQVVEPAAHLTCRAPRQAVPRRFAVTSVRDAG